MQRGGVEIPAVRRQARLIRVLLRPVALGLAGFYVLWNLVWLHAGSLPPSILTAMTGIPSPTTGGTRSLLAALHGDWASSVLWNPLTFVYLALAIYSGTLLGLQHLRNRRLTLPRIVAGLWVTTLVAGWIAKIAIGPRYW